MFLGALSPKRREQVKSARYKMIDTKNLDISRYEAPVVQTLDSATHRINHYPEDKYYGNPLRYPLDRDLSDG